MAPSDLLRDRLSIYSPGSPEEEEDALKEILQEVILFGLSNAGFFEHAAFQGGTSLRIVHDLPRFSEDLDFALLKPDADFGWTVWADAIQQTCERFGLEPDLVDRSKAGKAVQAMWLKDDSLGALLDLTFVHQPGKKLRIKLEIDTNPPAGATFERQFLEFPVAHPVETWDLPSNLAGKLHAMLCRTYVKGRDWFDFNWYVQRRVQPNLVLLSSALRQQGPWKATAVKVTPDWLAMVLEEKVASIDWGRARADVEPFLRSPHREALEHWEADLFLAASRRMLEYCRKP